MSLSQSHRAAALFVLAVVTSWQSPREPSTESTLPPGLRGAAVAQSPPPTPASSENVSFRFGGGCRGDEVAKCVARYAKPSLTPTDIKKFIEEGLAVCFDLRDPEKRGDQGACLPLSLGVDERNGKTVEVRYFCSDVCPDYGRMIVSYASTSEQECNEIGAESLKDPAWRAYIGCLPLTSRPAGGTPARLRP